MLAIALDFAAGGCLDRKGSTKRVGERSSVAVCTLDRRNAFDTADAVQPTRSATSLERGCRSSMSLRIAFCACVVSCSFADRPSRHRPPPPTASRIETVHIQRDRLRLVPLRRGPGYARPSASATMSVCVHGTESTRSARPRPNPTRADRAHHLAGATLVRLHRCDDSTEHSASHASASTSIGGDRRHPNRAHCWIGHDLPLAFMIRSSSRRMRPILAGTRAVNTVVRERDLRLFHRATRSLERPPRQDLVDLTFPLLYARSDPSRRPAPRLRVPSAPTRSRCFDAAAGARAGRAFGSARLSSSEKFDRHRDSPW